MSRTRPGGLILSEEQPGSRHRRVFGRVFLAGMAVVVAGAAYLGVRGMNSPWATTGCQAKTGDTAFRYTSEQMANASTIVAIAKRRGLPARAATIAVATALQESKLRNLNYGDRDSLGLFQQRTSQGWGTKAQILDPDFATNAFYDALVKIKGYESMEITKVAQAVQRSAAPGAYADHEAEGRVLADTLSGYTPGGVGCSLGGATAAGDGTTLANLLDRETGLSATVSGKKVRINAHDARSAWAAGSWAVAKADLFQIKDVSVADQAWHRAKSDGAYTWHGASAAVGAATVVITLN
ncbi:MAG: hypothetical protein ABI131_07320 [Nostocoides sp.]